MGNPVIYLFGGSNGAGKTTFARAYLPHEGRKVRFLNADEIARGLSPFSPQTIALKAGRVMLHEIRECIAAGQSFGMESTLSGKTYIGLLSEARKVGYEIELHYLWLPNADMAVRRVRQRVKKGAMLSRKVISAGAIGEASINCSQITFPWPTDGSSGTTRRHLQSCSRNRERMIICELLRSFADD